jgi:hypothetical protein
MRRFAHPKRPFAPIARVARRAAIAALCLGGAAVATGADAQAQVRLPHENGGPYTVTVRSWRDIPFRSVVRQQYDYSCGSAAVATLLTYHYGRPVTEADVFTAMYAAGDQERIRQVGFSMLDMKMYLDSVGFGADGLRVSLDRLAEAGAPGIALITQGSYRHFVVVKGVRGDTVLVGDPTLGLRTVDRAEFEAMWNGILLVVRNPPETAPTPVFNAEAEWQPWSPTPWRTAQSLPSNEQIFRDLDPLYQIRPQSDLFQ